MRPRTHLMVQQAEVLQTLGRQVGQRGQGAWRHQAQHEATRQPTELSAVGQQLNEQLLDPTPTDRPTPDRQRDRERGRIKTKPLRATVEVPQQAKTEGAVHVTLQACSVWNSLCALQGCQFKQPKRS